MYCELGLYPGLDVLGAGPVLWSGRARSQPSQTVLSGPAGSGPLKVYVGLLVLVPRPLKVYIGLDALDSAITYYFAHSRSKN